MAVNLLNTSSIAKEMQTKVTERMGNWFEAEFKAKANSASRRTRLIRSHGHTYTYARYQNTGQLSSNITPQLYDHYPLLLVNFEENLFLFFLSDYFQNLIL